ncbi:BKACE family enzyme [Tritonibacter horizontis]|uniref:3-keto-5-aminohexanoate cleavage enzyme n=1 Tax=Tritonibacter horizontis TaxID=1768241 RepID=A0A132BYC5_9RHOB|nr:3-keto-5-aminohexanoate cleavage protein [Tritonibacter horizontis]KUP93385.1 3-keto-5-aminohexanoate cleavage enzyme [Tritonibacter horizontis]
MRSLPRIMVAPNGARLQKSDHPALPITEAEMVACAKACFAAGAGGLHAHLRDPNGGHLLDAAAYQRLVARLKETVPQMAVQITTEAVGQYGPDVQMEIALISGADMVSVSIREILRAGQPAAAAFFRTCQQAGIAVQHILYDLEDCRVLVEALDPASLAAPDLQLLFVLGRYTAGGASSPAELDPFVDWMKAHRLTPDWAVCAFGAAETDCLCRAVARGGKCRVGFENALVLSDGRIARDNAEKVSDLAARLAESAA